MLLIGDAALIIRAFYEEETLGRDQIRPLLQGRQVAAAARHLLTRLRQGYGGQAPSPPRLRRDRRAHASIHVCLSAIA